MAATPSTSEDAMSMTPDPDLKPGDEAEPGTPGAGEGTGRVVRGIGGG
jgi:hypothetical protein